jgi:TRAP-type C4-dicarboxylate transport system substrate-binding protein
MGLSSIVSAADVTVNYVTFVNKMHPYARTFQQSFGIIEERSNGRIKFNYRGGPEAIKIFAQAMAVKKGATGMVFTTPSFTGKLVKGPLMLTLSESPVAKHKETGLYDYLNEVYNPVGPKYIQMIPEQPGKIFRMLCKDKIEKTSDLKGKSIGGSDWMDAVAPAFGMKTVDIRHNEHYSGLERGIIDISRMTIGSMANFKLDEVA